MKRNLTLAAVTLAAALALTACGGNGSGNSASAPSTEANDSVIEVSIGSSPESIDPALNTAIDAGNMIVHAFEGLLKFDENANIVGGLAEDWSMSEDGLTYTFSLRPDLKWSDGSALTANDFVYSWQRLADPMTAAPYAYDMLNMITGYEEAANGNIEALGVTAPDDQTLVVTLSSPCSYFEKVIAHTAMMPVQQATIEANADSWCLAPETYITNGAYYMTEFTDGSRIVFQKNPNYYDAENVTFDQIVWHLIEDANAAYSAYQRGELALTRNVPTEELASLQGSSDLHIEPVMGTAYIIFNQTKEPFSNPKVREALSRAIDRSYIAEGIMEGLSTPASNMVGPGVTDYAENSSFAQVTLDSYSAFYDVDNYEAELEKAKEALAEAGYPNGDGFPVIEYLVNDTGHNKAIAEYLQSAWSELGITLNINVQEWKTVTADRRAGNFDVARGGWTYDWDDPSNLLSLFESDNGNNEGKYSSAEYDALMADAKSTPNMEAHYTLLHEAEQLMLQDYACAPTTYNNYYWLQKENLKNVTFSPYGYWYFMYATLEDTEV